MFLNLGKIFLSILITNWLYSEAMLLFPKVEPYAQIALEKFSIPTHDTWPSHNELKQAEEVHAEFKSFILDNAPQIRHTAMASWLENKHVAPLKKEAQNAFDLFLNVGTPLFVSGDDIFSKFFLRSTSVVPGKYAYSQFL